MVEHAVTAGILVSIAVATVLAMELVACLAHRYVMHGFGWVWHRSHHRPRPTRLEANDLFAVFFAGVAVLLIWHGTHGTPWLGAIGVGMTVYGVLYFTVHDGMVHKRWPFRFTPRSGYLLRLYQAHHLHHAVTRKEGAFAFAFLWAPSADRLRRYRQRLRTDAADRNDQ